MIATTNASPLIKLIESSEISEELKLIAKKVLAGERISIEDGCTLYHQGELGFLGTLANFVREKCMAITPISIAIFMLSQQTFVYLIVSFVPIQDF